MNQADVSKLVSQLRYKVDHKVKRFRNPQGPEGRLHRMRQVVTGLFKHERVEVNYPVADEARGYAERLISDAIRHGDTHAETMEMADYWLLEKQLVHKLFKVLVPRYEAYTISYTRMLKLSSLYPNHSSRALLELRGNPYPPLNPPQSNRNMIHNILLEEAKKQYRAEKYEQMAKSIEEAGQRKESTEDSSSENTTGSNIDEKGAISEKESPEK